NYEPNRCCPRQSARCCLGASLDRLMRRITTRTPDLQYRSYLEPRSFAIQKWKRRTTPPHAKTLPQRSSRELIGKFPLSNRHRLVAICRPALINSRSSILNALALFAIYFRRVESVRFASLLSNRLRIPRQDGLTLLLPSLM